MSQAGRRLENSAPTQKVLAALIDVNIYRCDIVTNALHWSNIQGQ